MDNIFKGDPIMDTERMTIKIGDNGDKFTLGLSIKSQDFYDDKIICEILREIIRSIEAPTLEDPELF